MRTVLWLSVLVWREGMISEALVMEEDFPMLFHAADCMTLCPMQLGGSNNLFKNPWRLPSRDDFIYCCQRHRKLLQLTKALASHYSHWRSVDLRIKPSNCSSLHSFTCLFFKWVTKSNGTNLNNQKSPSLKPDLHLFWGQIHLILEGSSVEIIKGRTFTCLWRAVEALSKEDCWCRCYWISDNPDIS